MRPLLGIPMRSVDRSLNVAGAVTVGGGSIVCAGCAGCAHARCSDPPPAAPNPKKHILASARWRCERLAVGHTRWYRVVVQRCMAALLRGLIWYCCTQVGAVEQHGAASDTAVALSCGTTFIAGTGVLLYAIDGRGVLLANVQ